MIDNKSFDDGIYVLIPDGEHNYLRIIANCLSQVKEIKLFVMSNKKNTLMRYSRFIHHFSYYPETNCVKKWISNINLELKRHAIDIILPVFEVGMFNLIRNRNLLEKPEKLILMSSFDDYLKANDKTQFANHLDEFKLPSPVTKILRDGRLNIKEVEKIGFPMLAKPVKHTGGGEGIVKLDDQTKLDYFLYDTKTVSNYIFQQYTEGYDLGCNVLCRNGKILAYTIQKGFLRGKRPYSPQIGLNFIYKEEVLKLSENLMKSLNWSGVANIDLRFDVKSNSVKIIEVNPRYWATIEASLIAGINFPYLHCLASKNISFELPEYKRINYLSLKGLWISITKSPKLLLKPKFLWNHTPIQFLIKDPLAIFFHYLWVLKNIVVRAFKFE